MPTRKRRGGGKERERGVEAAVGRRCWEGGGLVDDDGGDLEEGAFFAVAFAFPASFLELAGLFFFFVVVFLVVFVAGAFLLLLLLLLLLGLFEPDAIGDDDFDADIVFFFFETVAVLSFAPSDALSDERVLRAIERGRDEREKRG